MTTFLQTDTFAIRSSLNSRQAHKFRYLYFDNFIFIDAFQMPMKRFHMLPRVTNNCDYRMRNESEPLWWIITRATIKHFLLIYCLSLVWLRDSKDLWMLVSNWYKKKEFRLHEYIRIKQINTKSRCFEPILAYDENYIRIFSSHCTVFIPIKMLSCTARDGFIAFYVCVSGVNMDIADIFMRKQLK